MELLGVLGLMDPFTTRNLRDRMIDGGAPNATTDQVSLLWDAYQNAVLNKGLSPFFRDAEWVPTFNFMVQQTEYPKMTVSAFLTALRAHSQENGTLEYLDPAQGAAAQAKAKAIVKDVIAAPGNIIHTAASPVIQTAAEAGSAIVGPLKWTAIGLAAAAALYVGYEVFTTLKPVKKAVKRKG